MKQKYSCSPDLVSASEQYAHRFDGPVGEFLLDVQTEIFERILRKYEGKPLKVLDVGGGHCQVSPILLKKGFEVWIHGSSECCSKQLKELLKADVEGRAHFFTSPLEKMPFDDDEFDLVFGIRLVGHIDDWQRFLSELARVSKRAVIIDYPPSFSFNLFYPLFFPLKKLIEGDTRTFRRFNHREIKSFFVQNGFKHIEEHKEFFLPMGIHRLVRRPRFSRAMESLCASVGLTRLFGSPAILFAEQIEMLL